MFKSVFLVEDCKVLDLKDKAIWEGGKQIGVKSVCSVVVFGDKPIVCEVPLSILQDIGNKINAFGSAKVEEFCSMEQKPFTKDDGSIGYSSYKFSKNFKLLQFIPVTDKK